MHGKTFLVALFCLIVLAGCPDEPPGLNEAVRSKTAVTAFRNVNLVSMLSEKVQRNRTVLIQDTRIVAVGATDEIDIPDHARVIDGSGAYLMPGLADMHMHIVNDWLSAAWPVSPMNLYLANGVTTVRCFGPMGIFPDYVLMWRDEIKAGKRIGPAIYTCGPILYGPVQAPKETVRAQKNQGFDFIKFYSYLSKDEFHQAMEAAKACDIYTAGHIPFQVGLEGVLAEGMDEIAHIEELLWEFVDLDRSRHLKGEAWMPYVIRAAFQQLEPLLDLGPEDIEKRHENALSKIVDRLQQADIPLCTTLVVDDVIVQKLLHSEDFLGKPENRYLPPYYMDLFRRGEEKHQRQFKGGEIFAPYKYSLDQILLARLKEAGLKLVLSTDAGTGGMGIVPGFSLHDELRILVENGFTPFEAIAAGTVRAAEVIRSMTGKADFGTIEAGKRADLILINGNPLDDVSNIRDMRGVMAAGAWYDRETLHRMITPGIPVTGALHHTHEPNGDRKTYMDIVIGKDFAGRLPDAIDTIAVYGPNGKLPVQKEDFTYLPRIRDFWIGLDGSPDIGTYTFEVTGRGERGSASDFQSVVRAFPIPDIPTFTPKPATLVRSLTPVFSWGPVRADVPAYYRLEINHSRGGRVYSTGQRKAMLSHRIPDGILKPGQSYRWRIRVTDSDHWLTTQNRSHSPWLTFTVTDSLE